MTVMSGSRKIRSDFVVYSSSSRYETVGLAEADEGATFQQHRTCMSKSFILFLLYIQARTGAKGRGADGAKRHRYIFKNIIEGFHPQTCSSVWGYSDVSPRL
ncbi:hypothetical protein JG687_00006743 [Phytophthora cactorum]|uniref:Uncharacterized protein n=1 Tax=Phytophthora cactorum TaxID=29920 RepID=A0A8T1ULZ2_9STRA|nr:hypothetical protein JG687_00006743 [Phytophthora cactorum]